MQTKVLIVETNKALAEMWCSYLKRHELDVAFFIQEETAVEEVKQWGEPNIIISGLEPGPEVALSGKELFSYVYGEEKELNPPVIQLHASHLSELEAKKVKTKSFILKQKPVSLAKLNEAVQKASFELLFAYYRDHHSAAMSAELKGDAIVGILQYIDASKRSGIILVKSGNRNAFLRFSEGKPVDAQYSFMAGTEAVYEILSWQYGESSFFESEIPASSGSEIPEINVLITEKCRQADEVKQSEKIFNDPGVYISRIDNVDTDPTIPSGKIYANLASEKTLAEILSALPGLSYRQVMVALNGMLLRDEIQYKNKAQKELAVNEKSCNEILEAVKDKKADEIITHPVTLGVFSGTPQLAKKFIGSLCHKDIAGKAVLNTGDRRVVITELPKTKHGIDFFDISASILVFDKTDTENMQRAVKFLQEVKVSSVGFP